jgi:uncharacterized protein (TIGR02246 family)
MASRWIIFLVALMLSASAGAGPNEDALTAYGRFFAAFTAGNHGEVAGLFAPDALFYGTGSPTVVTTPEGVRAYFTRALSSATHIRATLLESTALVLSDSVVAISGKWQSERTLDGKTVVRGPARNTVVMQKRGDRWLIVQFHNSPTPKPRPQTPAAKPPGSPPDFR